MLDAVLKNHQGLNTVANLNGKKWNPPVDLRSNCFYSSRTLQLFSFDASFILSTWFFFSKAHVSVLLLGSNQGAFVRLILLAHEIPEFSRNVS
jgi:hypothetical protein